MEKEKPNPNIPSNWDKLKLIQDSWFKMWSMYLSWFSWHFGIQSGALALVVANESAKKYINYMTLLMLFVDTLAIFVSLAMFRLVRDVSSEVSLLDNNSYNSCIMGISLSKFATFATLSVHLAIVVSWLLALRNIQPPPQT